MILWKVLIYSVKLFILFIFNLKIIIWILPWWFRETKRINHLERMQWVNDRFNPCNDTLIDDILIGTVLMIWLDDIRWFQWIIFIFFLTWCYQPDLLILTLRWWFRETKRINHYERMQWVNDRFNPVIIY